MKFLLAPAMVILVVCSNCTSDSTNSSTAGTETKTPNPEAKSATAKEYYKDGWDNLKQGSKQVAAGVNESAKDAGTAMSAAVCPIAADTHGRVYYAKDSPGYEKMLSAEKSDVRECFSSEAGAREKGYTLVR